VTYCGQNCVCMCDYDERTFVDFRSSDLVSDAIHLPDVTLGDHE